MCLADEDVPQRGRSRDKVEAARELEALCSGRSLLFDHSRCYEGGASADDDSPRD